MKQPDPLTQSIHAYLEGRATDSEIDLLNSELKRNPEALDRYLQFADLHSCLSLEETLRTAETDLPPLLPFPTPPPRPLSWISWLARPWMGAAAGLAVGLCGASIAWAIASPKPPRIIPVPFHTFADQPMGHIPSSFPKTTGIWSGDPSEIVLDPESKTGERREILRFLRAEADAAFPQGPAEACDVLQLIDLRPLKAQALENGDSLLQLTASFSDRRTEAGEPIRFSCRLFLYSGDPEHVRERWPQSQLKAVAAANTYCESPGGSPQTPHLVTVKTVLAPQADFAVLQLVAGPVFSPHANPPVLGEQYVSDVKLTLRTQTAPSPALNP
ncbi:MAG: hypothetical protein RLZZ399_554 [Verrucomicrobiota bacterium]|jgi:hypothetical protein